jgi:hypothetical protein
MESIKGVESNETPEYPYECLFISELKASIEKERGHKIGMNMASGLADDWIEQSNKAWKEFVVKNNEMLDHVYGRPGDPDWTKDRQVADFQWLYKQRFGTDLSYDQAKEKQDGLVRLIALLYGIDYPYNT